MPSLKSVGAVSSLLVGGLAGSDGASDIVLWLGGGGCGCVCELLC